MRDRSFQFDVLFQDLKGLSYSNGAVSRARLYSANLPIWMCYWFNVVFLNDGNVMLNALYLPNNKMKDLWCCHVYLSSIDLQLLNLQKQSTDYLVILPIYFLVHVKDACV